MTDQTNPPTHPPVPAARAVGDYTLPFLVENVQLLEDYLASMLQMIITHHPYMGPAASAIGSSFQERSNALMAKYPVSAIVLPPASSTDIPKYQGA